MVEVVAEIAVARGHAPVVDGVLGEVAGRRPRRLEVTGGHLARLQGRGVEARARVDLETVRERVAVGIDRVRGDELRPSGADGLAGDRTDRPRRGRRVVPGHDAERERLRPRRDEPPVVAGTGAPVVGRLGLEDERRRPRRDARALGDPGGRDEDTLHVVVIGHAELVRERPPFGIASVADRQRRLSLGSLRTGGGADRERCRRRQVDGVHREPDDRAPRARREPVAGPRAPPVRRVLGQGRRDRPRRARRRLCHADGPRQRLREGLVAEQLELVAERDRVGARRVVDDEQRMRGVDARAVGRRVRARRRDHPVNAEAGTVERDRRAATAESHHVGARREAARVERDDERARLADGESDRRRHGQVHLGRRPGHDLEQDGIAGHLGEADVRQRGARLDRRSGQHVGRTDVDSADDASRRRLHGHDGARRGKRPHRWRPRPRAARTYRPAGTTAVHSSTPVHEAPGTSSGSSRRDSNTAGLARRPRRRRSASRVRPRAPGCARGSRPPA